MQGLVGQRDRFVPGADVVHVSAPAVLLQRGGLLLECRSVRALQFLVELGEGLHGLLEVLLEFLSFGVVPSGLVEGAGEALGDLLQLIRRFDQGSGEFLQLLGVGVDVWHGRVSLRFGPGCADFIYNSMIQIQLVGVEISGVHSVPSQ